MGTLQNIDPDKFRRYLKSKGLKCVRTKGGHEMWDGENISRTIVFQTHISPVPEFIISKALKTLGANRKDIEDFMRRK